MSWRYVLDPAPMSPPRHLGSPRVGLRARRTPERSRLRSASRAAATRPTHATRHGSGGSCARVEDARPTVPETPIRPRVCPWEAQGHPETEVEVSEDRGARREKRRDERRLEGCSRRRKDPRVPRDTGGLTRSA